MRDDERAFAWAAMALCVCVATACALLLATNCTPAPVVLPPKERPEAGTPADCDAACGRLRALDCEEGKSTPGGGTCEDVCLNVQQSEATALDLACVVRAGSCSAANACGYGGPP